MDKRILDALVKLCDGDEEKAKKFAESIDGVNRTIADEKLVTRSEEPPVIEPVTPVVEPTTESFVFDDSMIVRVVQVLGEDPGFKTLVTSSYQVPVDLTPRVVSLESQDVSRSSKLAELETRLAKLEKPEEDKKKEWASEISEKTLRNIRVIYRPSEASPQGETSGEKEKMEEIASSTVSLIKT